MTAYLAQLVPTWRDVLLRETQPSAHAKSKDSMLRCKTFIIFVFTISKNGFKPVRKGLQLRVAALYFSSIVGQTFLLFSKAHTQTPKFSFAQLPLLSF